MLLITVLAISALTARVLRRFTRKVQPMWYQRLVRVLLFPRRMPLDLELATKRLSRCVAKGNRYLCEQEERKTNTKNQPDESRTLVDG